MQQTLELYQLQHEKGLDFHLWALLAHTQAASPMDGVVQQHLHDTGGPKTYANYWVLSATKGAHNTMLVQGHQGSNLDH